MTKPVLPEAAHPLRAIAFALTGFTCWAISDSINKLVLSMNVPNYQMMAINGMSGMLMIALVVYARGDRRKLKPRRLLPLLGYGLLLPINFCIILVALRYLSLTSFYAISFAAPLCVAGLSALFLREKLDGRKLGAIIAGFTGVLIAVNPMHIMDDRSTSIGILAAAVATLVFAVQQLLMRRLSRHETQESVAFYPRFVTITAGIIGIIIFGTHSITPSAIAYNCMAGCIGGFGWLCMAHAYKHATASTVAPFHYSQIISGAVIGYLVWGDVPKWNTVLGVAVIIASGIYIINHTRKKSIAPEVET